MRYKIWLFSIIFTAALAARKKTEKLEKPKNLRVQDQRETSFSIIWDHDTPPDAEIQFRVLYRHYSTGTDQEVTRSLPWMTRHTPTNAVFIDGVQLGHTYDLKIRAQDLNGNKAPSKWSNLLRVRIVGVGGTQSLPATTGLHAKILSPTAISLEWTGPQFPGIYYVVVFERINKQTGQSLEPPMQVTVGKSRVAIDKLRGLSTYKVSVGARKNPGLESTLSTPIRVTLPSESEIFRANQIRIRTFQEPSGIAVNITWSVPNPFRSRIKGYSVFYSTEKDAPSASSRKLELVGPDPHVTLRNLPPETEHFIRIQTDLKTGVITESDTFRFTTPPMNPIGRLNVIFASDVNSVRLEWTLNAYVDRRSIIGYIAHLSKDRDLPLEQWRQISTDSREATLTLNDLDTGINYFVKVFVRTREKILKSNTIFRFKTLEQHSANIINPTTLVYHRLSPEQIRIRWSYPEGILTNVTGALIMYTKDENQAETDWMKILIPSPNRTSVILTGLEPNKQYFVKVLPKLSNGEYQKTGGVVYRIHPSKTKETVRSEVLEKEDDFRSELCLKSCRPPRKDEPKLHGKLRPRQLCHPDEICVPALNNPATGWCLPKTLAQAAKNL